MQYMCKKLRFQVFIITLFYSLAFAFAQENITRHIAWKANIINDNNNKFEILLFKDALFPDRSTNLPYFVENFSYSAVHTNKFILSSTEIEEVPSEMLLKVDHLDKIPSDFIIKSNVGYVRKKPIVSVTILPLRKNSQTGKIERLVNFTLQPVVLKDALVLDSPTQNQQPAHSVLKSGNWIKIAIPQDGIYKLTYSELQSMGIAVPDSIRIFGNGGGMLPSLNNVSRPDDLVENAIEFDDAGSYVLFFAQGSYKWTYNPVNETFTHQVHKYSDNNYYFITSDMGRGKTIAPPVASSTQTATDTVTTFNDYAYHELDLYNLLSSGSEWFGEEFSYQLTYSFPFSFPNVDISSAASLHYDLIGRSAAPSNFQITSGNDNLTVPMDTVGVFSSTDEYASESNGTMNLTPSDNLNININYNANNYSGAIGYLNYLEVFARRNLIMTGSQMPFRDVNSVGTGNVANFQISNTQNETQVWDITNIYNITQIQGNNSGNSINFNIQTDSLHNFIALNPSAIAPFQPTYSAVPNQDLHGLGQPDLIIVTHPNFMTQAQELAAIRSKEGMNVIVATQDQIFNEFSSGMPDVSAIRDFVKLYYDRSQAGNLSPKYLLLFGDGSYDNKTPISQGNTNYILTYESLESLNQSGTFVTDDYFGILEYNEDDCIGPVDVGIGRLPVETTEDADLVLSKIKSYQNPGNMGDWRNVICFTADDSDGSDGSGGDGSLHEGEADDLATYINATYPDFITPKIYIANYIEYMSATGETCPDANLALNNVINQGALIINWTGHGSTSQLASEALVTNQVISEWTNINKLFFFFTATCDFGRFDQVTLNGTSYSKITCSAVNCLLSKIGGAIGLISASRVVYASSNYELNLNFYNNLINTADTNYRMGDIVMAAKNATASLSGDFYNNRCYNYFGDPSLRLAVPERNTVITDSMNGKSIKITVDTLEALGNASFSGHVIDQYGNNYNGIINPTVLDKVAQQTTTTNYGYPPFTFNVQNSIIFRGLDSVKNGDFKFNFLVPKDINYDFGKGKIVYYSNNESLELAGYNDSITIGGVDYNNNYGSDTTGPQIKLYMNDTTFQNGGITDANPIFLAYAWDICGINTTGDGIGHDITIEIDGDAQNIQVLNDYYQSSINNFQAGVVTYPLYNLAPGSHTILFTIWDGNNNSSVAEINFVVISNNIILNNLSNYPNPFSSYTNFTFSFNKPGENISVSINIYSLSGLLIKTLLTNINSYGFTSPPIQWDGTADNSGPVSSGIYIYSLRITDSEGQSAEKYGKLIIIR